MEARARIAVATLTRLIFEQRALLSGLRYTRSWFVTHEHAGVWFVSGRAATVLPHLHALVDLVRRGDATPLTVAAWLDFVDVRVRFVLGAAVPRDFDVASDALIRIELSYDDVCIATTDVHVHIDARVAHANDVVRTTDDAWRSVVALVTRAGGACRRCGRAHTSVVCDRCLFARYCTRACRRADAHHACAFLASLRVSLGNYASFATIESRITPGYAPPSSST